jgi:F-box-like
VISVDTLPDDVLVAIFDYYVNDDTQLLTQREEAWQSLVHVCRRWRSIIFASPRYLNLQLVCSDTTPARDMLDVWPALPLIISHYGGYRAGGADNIIAVLERRDRVCQITVQSSNMEIFLAAMQQPFPELTDLSLCFYSTTVPVVPDSFLGGSAPRLEHLLLDGIPFPGLPKLLLSATHLVDLYLSGIPHSGYISPDVMATSLFALTSLQRLTLKFRSPRSCPGQASRRLPPSTRSVLPVLSYFWFEGVTKYLEDLVACIDAPRLNKLNISFINDIVFDTPRFMQFISRTPMSRALKKAHLSLRNCDANLCFSSQASGDGDLYVEILRQGLDWQLSSLEQFCTSSLPPLSMLKDLYIYEDLNSEPDWKDDIENGLWLQLLHPFTAVKNLYLSEEIALRIGPALQELAEGRTTEVLPALQNIFLDGLESSGPVQEGIGKFVAVRQVASRPMAVSSWANSDRDKGYYQSD